MTKSGEAREKETGTTGLGVEKTIADAANGPGTWGGDGGGDGKEGEGESLETLSVHEAVDPVWANSTSSEVSIPAWIDECPSDPEKELSTGEFSTGASEESKSVAGSAVPVAVSKAVPDSKNGHSGTGKPVRTMGTPFEEET